LAIWLLALGGVQQGNAFEASLGAIALIRQVVGILTGTLNSGQTDILWLVIWNMFFIFPYIGNVIIPTDFHIFQRG
jgi:hypothetical protein